MENTIRVPTTETAHYFISSASRACRVASSLHLRCTAAKRGTNVNPISENNFSPGRILARLFKPSDLPQWLSRPAATLSSLPVRFPPSPRRVLIFLFPACRSIFSIPPLLKPRSFLLVKECPRSFDVTYDFAGNNDKR